MYIIIKYFKSFLIGIFSHVKRDQIVDMKCNDGWISLSIIVILKNKDTWKNYKFNIRLFNT